MSKQRRRPAPPVVCGGRPQGDGPAALLGHVAAALDACERAGVKVRLRHGIVETADGYVLPIAGTWQARTRTYDPFLSPPPGPEPDDD